MALLEPGLDLICGPYGLAERKSWKTHSKSNSWPKAVKLVEQGGDVDFFSVRKHTAKTILGHGTCTGGAMLVFANPELEDGESGRCSFSGIRRGLLDGVSADIGCVADSVSGLPSTWYTTLVNKWYDPLDKYPAEWTKSGKHLLDVEFQLLEPKLVVACGADAIKALLGTHATYERHYGEIGEFSTSEGVSIPIICTYDPLDVVSVPELYGDFLDGIRHAVEYLEGRRFDAPESNLHRYYCKNLSDLAAVLAIAESYWAGSAECALALDAEWHGDHPGNPGSYVRCFQFSWAPQTAALVEMSVAGGLANPESKAMIRMFNDFLFNNQPKLIGHFLTADLEWLIPAGLYELYDLWKKNGFDTGLAAHSLWETSRLKLEYLAHKHLGIPRYDYPLKDWLERRQEEKRDDNGYGEVPDSVLYPYGMYDADATYRLYQYLEPRLKRDSFGLDCRETFRRKMDASLGVYEINTSGLLIDRQRLDELTLSYCNMRAQLIEELQRETNWEDFNPGSGDHVINVLFGQKYTKSRKKVAPSTALCLGLTPLYSTGDYPVSWEEIVKQKLVSDFTPSTDSDTLGALSLQHPLVAKLRNFRFIDQALKNALREPVKDRDGVFIKEGGRFVYPRCEESAPGAIGSDGRLRTHMYPTTETGRWASARPNLQNWSGTREVEYRSILGDSYPGSLRSMIVASPGFYLVEADYSGAEVALAAFQSDDQKMIGDVLNPKHDMHSFVACLAFGLQCEKSKKGLESIGKSHYRHLAKIVFFRLSYGGGPKAIVIQANALGLPVTLEDAEQVISTIFRLYPNFHEWLEACAARAISPRWISTHGRSFRRVPKVDDNRLQVSYGRQFKNFPEQGGVADVVNEAVYNGVVYREETGMNYRTVLQVHDSLMYEVAEDQVKRFVNEAVPEFMVKRIPIYATDLNGIKTGKRYHLRVGVNVYRRWGEPIEI